MSTKKTCSRCKEDKELSDFGKLKASKDGLRPACKECSLAWYKEYAKTKTGLVRKMYNQQLKSSRKRGHPEPSYNCKELTKAILDMPLFNKLYKEWVSSGYDKDLIPSIDRDDNLLPYTEDNITLMTWGENNRKYHKDVYEGNSTQCRPVTQLTLDGKFIREFKSISIAGRALGISNGFISDACSGRYKTAKGYKFMYT